jgi:hypothetical protein
MVVLRDEKKELDRYWNALMQTVEIDLATLEKACRS